MREMPINNVEKGPDKNPKLQEIWDQITALVGDNQYTEKNIQEDEQGVIAWDVETIDAAGDPMMISYERAKTIVNRRTGVATEINPQINTALFVDGFPVGAGRQFEYIDGAWVENTKEVAVTITSSSGAVDRAKSVEVITDGQHDSEIAKIERLVFARVARKLGVPENTPVAELKTIVEGRGLSWVDTVTNYMQLGSELDTEVSEIKAAIEADQKRLANDPTQDQ